MLKTWHEYSLIILLIFLFYPLYINGQDTLNTAIELPEIIELEYDNLEMQNWLPSETGLLDGRTEPYLRIETRQNWKPATDLLTNRLIVSPADHKTSSVPRLYSAFYQKLKQGDKPVNLAQIGLFAGYNSHLKTLALGSFRLQAGEGLCLGAYNKASVKQSSYIIPAYSFSHPVMTGFATELNLAGINWISWLAQTRRIARLEAGEIERLYESSLTITDNKDKVMESTGGLVADFVRQHYNLGAYFYRVDFDKAFSDTTFTPLTGVYGCFGSYDNKPVSLGFEANLAGEKSAVALRAGYNTRQLTQSLRYIYRQEANPLSYSRTAQIFGQKTGREELSWDVRYRILQGWTLVSRIAAVKDLTDEADTRWKERLIFTVNHSESNWQTGLTYYRFQRDAVPVYDTLSTEILPTQNRLKAYWKQDLSQQISYKVTCQYQHYLDRKVTKNGLSLQQAIVCKLVKTDFGISFTAWTNQKSTYQPTELPTDEELLIQGDSDTAFRLYVKHEFSQLIAVSLNAYHPNTKVSTQSYWLNLQTKI